MEKVKNPVVNGVVGSVAGLLLGAGAAVLIFAGLIALYFSVPFSYGKLVHAALFWLFTGMNSGLSVLVFRKQRAAGIAFCLGAFAVEAVAWVILATLATMPPLIGG